jgi:hypothetical protein
MIMCCICVFFCLLPNPKRTSWLVRSAVRSNLCVCSMTILRMPCVPYQVRHSISRYSSYCRDTLTCREMREKSIFTQNSPCATCLAECEFNSFHRFPYRSLCLLLYHGIIIAPVQTYCLIQKYLSTQQ